MMVSDRHVVLIKGGSESIFRRTVKRRYNMPPLGLLDLAAFLSAHGYIVKVVDLITEDHSAASLERTLRSWGVVPLLVGISVYTDTAPASVEIAGFVKQCLPETTVAVGGPHPTFQPEEMLACPAIDVVVRGEGESTLVELLEALKHPSMGLAWVSGLSYKEAGGRIRTTPARPPLQALDTLPLPCHDAAGGTYGDVFCVVSSRGCPARCMFCASRAYSGSVYRMHSAEWLFSLVYAMHRRSPFRIMDILDDTFTANRTRTKRFCALLRASGLGISMRVKSRVDYIRDDVVATLADAGCIAMHIGVESADEGVLRAIGKGITPEQIMRAIGILRKYGVRVDTSLMIGHPFDTRDTIERTIILAAALKRIGTVAVGISTPYPGTELARRAAELKLSIEVTNWRKYDTVTPIYSAPGFTLNDLRRAYYMFDKRRDELRGSTILTGNRHEDYWARLDSWIAEVAAPAQV